MEDRLSGSIAEPRFYTALLLVFGGVALLLALAGVYGTVSYTVGRREREMGIRIALGAQPSQVQTLVLRKGMPAVAWGTLVGLGASAYLSRFLARLLFGIEPLAADRVESPPKSPRFRRIVETGRLAECPTRTAIRNCLRIKAARQ